MPGLTYTLVDSAKIERGKIIRGQHLLIKILIVLPVKVLHRFPFLSPKPHHVACRKFKETSMGNLDSSIFISFNETKDNT